MTEARSGEMNDQRESSPDNNGTDSSTATTGKKKRTGPKRRKVTHGMNLTCMPSIFSDFDYIS